MQELYNVILALIPTKMQTFLYTIGAALGSVVGYIFNGIDKAFYWLLIFVSVDYITGLIQAIKNKNISSKVGFVGILKKVVILSVVILFHGLADIAAIPVLETAVIFAFCLNELYSILENIERAGLGSVIPPQIAQLLAIVESKTEEKIKDFK